MAPEEWFGAVKPELLKSFPMANLPYVKFDNVLLTETDSIMRLTAQKFGPQLLGSDPKEIANCEILLSAIIKAFQKSKGPTMSPECPSDEVRKDLAEAANTLWEAISHNLGNQAWLAGVNVTIADIAFYEALQWFKVVHAETMAKYEHFDRWMADFEELEWFKAYKSSDKWMEAPMNAPTAGLNNI